MDFFLVEHILGHILIIGSAFRFRGRRTLAVVPVVFDVSSPRPPFWIAVHMPERISFTDCSDPPIPRATDFILDSWQSGKVSADPDQGRRQKVSKSSLEDDVKDDVVYM